MAEHRWHAVHREQFDEAEARAIGAFVGYLSARGAPVPHITGVFQSAFRRAVSETFDAGVNVGRWDRTEVADG